MAKSKQATSKSHSWSIPVLPIIYLFLVVFPLRSNVAWFYALGILLAVAVAFLAKNMKLSNLKNLAAAMLVLGSIGLAAATILTIEKIELLKDPDHVTSCSISPVVACSPVIASDQATAIAGIANPVFGLFGFSLLIAAGMTIWAISGSIKLSKYWWYALLGGVMFGVGFCIWLIHEALYDIGALCLYCMSVWAVTFSLFWFLLSAMEQEKIIKASGPIDRFIVNNRNLLIAVSFGVVALMIYFRWADYWNGLF